MLRSSQRRGLPATFQPLATAPAEAHLTAPSTKKGTTATYGAEVTQRQTLLAVTRSSSNDGDDQEVEDDDEEEDGERDDEVNTTVMNARTLKEQSPSPASGRDSRGRIFFLFMTTAGMSHTDYWHSFFAGTDPTSHKVFMHCTDYNVCALQLSMKNPLGVTLVDTVPSEYCRDLVSPMVQLLRVSIGDSDSPKDKFVFVSDTTLPVKPFALVQDALTEHDHSDICVQGTVGWREYPIPDESFKGLLVKHSQWVVLNQAHARRMIEQWPKVMPTEYGAFQVPVLPLHGNRLSSTHAVLPLDQFRTNLEALPLACTDEWAIFATLFGALPSNREHDVELPGFGKKFRVRGEVASIGQGTCRTFAFWQGGGQITTNPDFADLVMHLGGSLKGGESTHPAEFSVLDDKQVGALRDSRFLFARKFRDDGITLDQFERLILSA